MPLSFVVSFFILFIMAGLGAPMWLAISAMLGGYVFLEPIAKRIARIW